MPYQFQKFEVDSVEVPLPLFAPEQDHSPMPAKSRFQSVIGGSADLLGDEDSDADGVQTHTLTGIYWGETTYLVDEAGNYFTDESGNRFIFGNGSTMLRSQITALREVYRKQGTLWRALIEDGTLSVLGWNWKTATFDQMSQPQITGDRVFKATITCGFSTQMANWRAETQTTVSASVTAAVPKLFIVENAGETVEDGIVTVTRTSGTVTAFSLACTALGISWVWTGSIGSGEVVTVNDGDDTVIKSNAAGTLTNAYSGFSRPDHSAASWLKLPRGTHLFYVTVLGGNATVAFKHYTQVK